MKKQVPINTDNRKTADIVANKSKFIAHEIKNSLSIINLYSKILEKRIENIKAEDDIIESVKNSIKNITNASQSISYLISDLRCLSSPYKTEVNIMYLINETIEQCKQKAEEKDIFIDIQNILDINVNTDRIKVQCAIINILYNAIEACEAGCKIDITTYIKDNNLVIQIKNNGQKIPKNLTKKIFEPEFTTKETGSGLGLAICKTELNLVNGEIDLVKSDDKETVFEITIPLY